MNVHLSVPYFTLLFPWNYSDRRTFVQNQKVYETSDADIYGIAFTDFYCKDLKVNEIKINNIHL